MKPRTNQHIDYLAMNNKYKTLKEKYQITTIVLTICLQPYYTFLNHDQNNEK